MNAIRAWLQLSVGLILLLAAILSVRILYSQLLRDRECDENIQEHVQLIEAFRVRQGRLPRLDEIRAGGPAIISLRVPDEPHRAGDSALDYEFDMWRGERAVHYASTTKKNTCDSGALRAAPWLTALLLIPGLALTFLGSRRLRSGSKPSQ